MKITAKRKYAEAAFALCVLIFCEFVFFRNALMSDALFGDIGDGRLTTLLTEHWWRFFTGKEKFTEIAMFYPCEEVFGYTDLFLGYGIVHSVFRLFGMDMYISYKWTLILIHIMGTISMYYLLKKTLNCSLLWSLFGTIAFCFSNNYAIRIGHTQLNAVAYLPLLLIFLVGFFQNYQNRRRRNLYSYVFVIWFVLLTYTSWYVACFTGLYCLIFLIVYLLCLKAKEVKIWAAFKPIIQMTWKDLTGCFLVMVVLYIPFLLIYLPVMLASSGYTYQECVPYLPEFADIINVSEDNFLLGPLMSRMELSRRGYSGEVVQGFSIILLGLFLLMFIMHNRAFSGQNQDGDNSSVVFKRILIPSTFISIIVGILLVIRLSANGVSLWWFVYNFIPVGKSMRAVARFLFWLNFPMAVITAYTANWYFKNRRTVGLLISVLAVAAIFVSNIHRGGASAWWYYSQAMESITSVSQPPEDVESFYIIDSSNAKEPEYVYQLDAFEIATWYDLKTINGYSGQAPADWSGIWNPCSEAYQDSVDRWIDAYALEHVYAYDKATNTWIPHGNENRKG